MHRLKYLILGTKDMWIRKSEFVARLNSFGRKRKNRETQRIVKTIDKNCIHLMTFFYYLTLRQRQTKRNWHKKLSFSQYYSDLGLNGTLMNLA